MSSSKIPSAVLGAALFALSASTLIAQRGAVDIPKESEGKEGRQGNTKTVDYSGKPDGKASAASRESSVEHGNRGSTGGGASSSNGSTGGGGNASDPRISSLGGLGGAGSAPGIEPAAIAAQRAAANLRLARNRNATELASSASEIRARISSTGASAADAISDMYSSLGLGANAAYFSIFFNPFPGSGDPHTDVDADAWQESKKDLQSLPDYAQDAAASIAFRHLRVLSQTDNANAGEIALWMRVYNAVRSSDNDGGDPLSTPRRTFASAGREERAKGLAMGRATLTFTLTEASRKALDDMKQTAQNGNALQKWLVVAAFFQVFDPPGPDGITPTVAGASAAGLHLANAAWTVHEAEWAAIAEGIHELATWTRVAQASIAFRMMQRMRDDPSASPAELAFWIRMDRMLSAGL